MNIELKKEAAPVKKNFDFVDSIRCLAMMGIVMEHSTYNGTYIFKGFPPSHILYISLIQFPKFGTAAFFILAGFLLGSKFVDYTPVAYFKRRLSNTFLPWLIWSLLFVVTMFIKMYVISHKGTDFTLLGTIGDAFKTVYLFTNYWFIINFLICIGVLLLFRKYLYSLWFGAILLFVSFLYSVNVHYEWFIPQHTTAIFGFVFFLWLGAQLNKHWESVQLWLNKVPFWLLTVLLIITFISCIYEIMGLYANKSVDPYNTLRVSNILYSMVAIVLLLKIKKFNLTKYFKPRETTFGIYLVHYIIVYNLLSEILRPLHFPQTQNQSLLELFAISFLRFVIIYVISFAIVTGLERTKYRWIIGR
jgi:hypothetical protein